MSTADQPTIWELLAEAATTLPEPFTRTALINWVGARRPDVTGSSIAAHISFATDNAVHGGRTPFAARTPLLHRVERGSYRRYRAPAPGADVAREVPAGTPVAGPSGRVLLVGSSGGMGREPRPARELFESSGFARARDLAVRSGAPWFVLSAKHGLLDPDDVVGPFDVLFGDQPVGYRITWGEWVVVQLGDRLALQDVVVEVHGGVDFAQPLRAPLARRGAVLDIALPDGWAEPVVPAAPSTADATPARSALDRLRGLVGRQPQDVQDRRRV
jgi:hypothetical protein